MNTIINGGMNFVTGIPKTMYYISGFATNMEIILNPTNFMFIKEIINAAPNNIERWYVVCDTYQPVWLLVELESKPTNNTEELKLKH
jgi:hypothetical protein